MSILDVFNGSGYSSVELTAAVNRLPFVPSRLGDMGLFAKKGVTTTTVAIERKSGKIGLIPTKTRGGGGTTKKSAEKRDLRPFNVPHIPYDDELLADDIQGVRAFGTDNRLEAINQKVNEKLESLRQDHEITHEYHRIGALKGVVLDADGSTTLVNLFTEFGISQTQVPFLLDTTTTDVKALATGVTRAIQASLGAVPFSGIGALCGNAFWDSLIGHPVVKSAFNRFQENIFARTDQRMAKVPFTYLDIQWENYRGSVGDVSFIPTNSCRFFPIGVPDLFVEYYAPADFIETVNTIGQPIYAKQERMKFDRGIELHTQSNPCILCTRPEVLIEGLRTS